ncbi:MAG: response regulator [Flavobacteriales bacterium]|nr:response regulator [Flavobacteriales bacterium]
MRFDRFDLFLEHPNGSCVCMCSMAEAQERRLDHIVLIDDEEDCNFVTKLVLQRSGYKGKLTCFTSARAALDHLEQAKEAPDLYFVDINMPGMTGFEFMEQCIEQGSLPNGRSSVVMFSSSNRPCDMERARSLPGVIGYVEKALTPEAFEEVKYKHLHAGNGNLDNTP